MRYLEPFVRQDLKEKCVFLSGPRQVGKTTLALNLLKDGSREHPAYLNWDEIGTRQRLLKGELPNKEPLLIFDEIHRYGRWRNFIKGIYDTRPAGRQILVTGSARLNHYRRGGDSMLGRYWHCRLHPFSLREMNPKASAHDLQTLLKFGGFPEPLFKGSERTLRRWHLARMDRLLREDVRDLERVRDVHLLELLAEALPSRVGSPLSVKGLREDLQVAQDTVERWIQILENLFVIFRIPPFGAPRIRAVKKEQKLYFWDWSQVSAEGGARFENLVASQLLKYCHFQEDVEGHKMELRFIRDFDKREVDFVVLKDRKPEFAVECKTGERALSPATRYFRERTSIPRFYQVHLGKRDHGDEFKDTRLLPFTTFCQELKLP
jgi:predicted AAA+ superfamily ATPase